MTEIYLGLFISILFALFSSKHHSHRFVTILLAACKFLFISTMVYVIFKENSLPREYSFFLIASIPLILILNNEWKSSALLMSVLLVNIFLLLYNENHNEFIMFMVYMLTGLVLTSPSRADVLRSLLINTSFYVMAWIFLYVSGHGQPNEEISMEILFLALIFFTVILVQCVGISLFPNHRDELYLKKDKSGFNSDILFTLFVLPVHLAMLRPIFFSLSEKFREMFLAVILFFFFVYLFQEYIKREKGNLMAVVNIKIIVIHVILSVYLAGPYEYEEILYYVAIPFVFIHFPFAGRTGTEAIPPHNKTSILNYLFAFIAIGIGPSFIFKTKTYALLLLFRYNSYICLIFILLTTLVIIKFLIFFIKNRPPLIFHKKPLKALLFSVILFAYFFSGHIPDKM